MPTYEYHCEKCKKDFELFQSMKDNAVAICPKDKCRRKTWGKGKVRRLLGTGAGLIFKGSGFYTTDYRSEGYKKAAKDDASASAPPKPADSKPETTPKATPAPTAPKPAPPAAESKKSKKKE
jgi:putative FmdB family regulatory protein